MISSKTLTNANKLNVFCHCLYNAHYNAFAKYYHRSVLDYSGVNTLKYCA